jgi:squalene-associated FAD-dependent desaturase
VPPRVTVIGGGVAGLSAAAALAEQGVRVTLLEARSTLGGRCSTFTDPATGERVDNGQHILIGCYTETFRFLRRIGGLAHVREQANLSLRIVDRHGVSSLLRCPPWPAPLHLLGGLLGWKALTWRDRVSSLRILPAIRRASAGGALPGRPGTTREGGDSGEETVRAWLRRHGQTERLIEVLWEPLAIAALNQSIDAAAAAPFRDVVRRMFTARRRDATLVLPTVPLAELFAAPTVAFVQARDGEVIAGAPARMVAEPGSSRVVVRTRDAEIAADAIVCAVPWFALPDVLPDVASLRSTIDAARHTQASPIVTVNLWLDRQVAGEEFVGLPGRHMQWIFDKARLFGESAAHLSLVSSGAEEIAARGNADLLALAMEELRAALPAASDAVVKRAVVVREKRATFSLAPGQPARPGTSTGVPGLFLAGDWIDTGLPATIESAVVSGHWAAASVLAHLEGLQS